MSISRRRRGKRRPYGFTLVEVLIGTFIMGIVILALAGGMTFSVSLAGVNSQTLRATQILSEKMELIRVCNWTQITNGSGFIPANFTVPYYPPGSSNALIYIGSVTIGNTPATETYRNDLRQITVAVTWTSANSVTRTRSMTTFVSPYGIQNYSY